MPYESYSHLSDEDLASVVVYLRSLKPIYHVVPPTQIPFPVNYLMNSGPQPITGPVSLARSFNGSKTGGVPGHDRDMRRVPHSTEAGGNRSGGLKFGGGSSFKGPWGEVASANITPDASGISYYDETLFVQSYAHLLCEGAEAQIDHAVVELSG